MQDMMLTGRVYTAEEGDRVGFAQYLVPDGTGLEKAMDLSKKISKNAPMTNYALTNVLPRIVEAGTDVGLMLEAMTAAIAQEAPEAKQRLRDFLEGRAKKVGEI
jgi:enoyl-CoA hydratase/carnithine racemase